MQMRDIFNYKNKRKMIKAFKLRMKQKCKEKLEFGMNFERKFEAQKFNLLI